MPSLSFLRGRWLIAIGALWLFAACDRPLTDEPQDVMVQAAAQMSPMPLALVGERIFHDRNLSIGRNQSCADCHDPAWGFTGPNSVINAAGSVYEGSIHGRFGNRRPPTAAYATPSPVLLYDAAEDVWIGGNFWDGRATGMKLGNPAADQAQGPFLNPVEQALASPGCVVYRVSRATYSGLAGAAFGREIFEIAFPLNTDQLCAQEGAVIPLSNADQARVARAYDQIALAIAAYEDSDRVNAFSSKYDHWLAGKASLTSEEQWGLQLYEGKALCSACHPNAGKRALFTDFTYDNLGVPRNPANPMYQTNPAFIDLGLGNFLGDAAQYGKQKVPTLRNVDKRPHPGAAKSFMHNGVFKTLQEVVHFYNTRDVLPDCATASAPQFGVNCWPAAEVSVNVNVDELGNLGLTAAEERAVVAFLRTLSDGWKHNH